MRKGWASVVLDALLNLWKIIHEQVWFPFCILTYTFTNKYIKHQKQVFDVDIFITV